MHSDQITAIVIVAIITVGIILRSMFGGHRHPVVFNNPEGGAENKRLREEVQELKERLKVLERITIEKENSLAKEIESLRDR